MKKQKQKKMKEIAITGYITASFEIPLQMSVQNNIHDGEINTAKNVMISIYSTLKPCGNRTEQANENMGSDMI